MIGVRGAGDTPPVNPRVSRILLEVALVVAGFTLLAVLITWPAAANANDVLPTQGIPWDPAGFTWDLWQRLQEGMPLFGTGSTAFVAPFTIEYPAAFNLVQLAFYGPAVAVAAISTPVLAMNVMIISGIAFSGMAMYALVRWLGCGPGVSSWAGAALAIAPYVVGKAVVHAMMANVACFPLLILACLWWNERPSWKRALAVTGAFALAWTTTAYYGLMAVVIVLVICGWGVISLRRRRGWRPVARAGGMLAGLLGLLVLLPVAISVASSGVPTPARSSAELADFGARPADYLVPPPGGWLARGVDAAWTGRLDSTGEQLILYVGISVLAVALAAMLIAWWRPGLLASARAVSAARIGSVLAAVLAWFSLAWPIGLGPVPIPVPSIVVWQVFPEVRAFARFGAPLLVVLLAVGALAIAALARRGGPVWRHSIIAAALVITGADLMTALPVTTSPPATADSQAPTDRQAWAWLRDERHPGAVVEYPTGPYRYVPELEQTRHVWQVGQMIHGRPVLNGFGPMGQLLDRRAIDLAQQVGNPAMPGAAQDLATSGVGFATVNPWAYGQYRQGTPPNTTQPPAGFALAATFADGTAIWRVTAAPAPVLAVFRQPGFAAPEDRDGRAWHPMAAPVAQVTTWAPARGTHTLEFPVSTPPGASVSATVRGAPAATVRVVPGAIRITMRTGPGGRDIRVSATPPAGVAIGRPEVDAPPAG